MGVLLDELYYSVKVETDELDKGVEKTEDAADRIERAMEAPVGAANTLNSSLETLGAKITDVMTGVTTDLDGIEEAAAAAAKSISVNYAQIEREIAKGLTTDNGQDIEEWWREQFGEVEGEAALTGPKLAKSLTEGLRMQFDLAMADIREAVARGLMTDAQASAAGIAAGKAYNDGVLKVIEQQDFSGPEGNQLFVGLTKQLTTVQEVGKKAGVTMTQLRGPLTSLATSSLGVNRSLGQLVSTLSLMGVSGGVVLGATAAIVALSKLYTYKKTSAEKAKEAVRKLREEIEKKISGDPVNQLITAISTATTLQEEADRLAARAAEGRATIAEAEAKGLTVLAAIKKKQADNEREAEAAQRIASRARIESITQQNALNADLARNLNALVEAGKADANQTAARAAFLANFRAELDNENTTLERKVELLGIIDDLTSKPSKANTDAAKTLDQGIEGLADIKNKLLAVTADATVSILDDAAAKVVVIKAEMEKVIKDLAGNPALIAEARRTGEALVDAITSAAETAEAERIATAQRDLRDLIAGVASEFGAVQETVAGGLTRAVNALEEKLRIGNNLTEESAAQIAAWRAEIGKLEEVTPLLEDIDALIEGLNPADNLEDLRTQLGYFNNLRSVTAKLIAEAEAEGPAAGARVAELKARLDALEEVLQRLRGTFADIVNTQDSTADKIGRVGREVASIAQGVVGLAQAFGGLDAQTAAVLQNVIAIGENIGGALAGNPASIFATLGGLAGLASSVFGESPAEKERKEISKRNTEALMLLAQRIGELSISFKGNQITGFQSAARTALDFARGSDTRFELAGQRIFEAALKQLGLTMDQASKLAGEMGITLDGTRKSLEDFEKALSVAEFARFAESFSGQRSAAGLAEKLGITEASPEARFSVLVDQLKGSSSLFSGLDAASLSSAEGRDQLLGVMRGLFSRLLGDGERITAEELGDLIPQDVFAGLNELIDIFNDFTGSLGEEVVPTLSGALQKLNQRFLAFNVTDIGERTAEIVRTASEFSPALGAVLDGLDTTTAEGRAQIITAIQGLFTGMVEAGEEIAGVTSDDLLGILGSLFSLDASEQADLQKRADAAAAALTEAQQEARSKALTSLSNAKALAGLEGLGEGDLFTRLLDSLAGIAPGLVEALGDIDVSTEEAAAQARGRLAQLFQQILSATEDVDAEGIAFLGNLLEGTSLTIEDLMGILVDLGGVAGGVRDPVLDTIDAINQLSVAMTLLNAEFAIFNIDNPIAQLNRLQQELVGLSPAISSAISGIDLSTDAGRASARAALQGLFEDLRSGALDASGLGGISEDDFLSTLVDISNSITRADAFARSEAERLEAEARRAEEEAKRNITKIPSRSQRAFGPVASEGQAVLLLGYASAQVSLLRQIASHTAMMAGLRAPIIGSGARPQSQRTGGLSGDAALDSLNRAFGQEINGDIMTSGNGVRTL